MNWPIPPTEEERQVGDSQSQKARSNLRPRDSILHQTVNRLPGANKVFLGSWTVDIRHEGHSQRSGLQRRHTEHLRWRSQCTRRKPKSWDRGVVKMHCPAGRVHSPSTWLPELLQAGKGTKRRPN